jgi:hypothetical protein
VGAGEKETERRAWDDGDEDGGRKGGREGRKDEKEEKQRKAGGNDMMLAVFGTEEREREGGREGGRTSGTGTGCKGGSHYFYLPTIYIQRLFAHTTQATHNNNHLGTTLGWNQPRKERNKERNKTKRNLTKQDMDVLTLLLLLSVIGFYSQS